MHIPRFSDRMNRIRLFYFFFEAGLGIYYTYNVVYFERQLGLSGKEIGLLGAMSPLMTLLIAPVWGNLADRRGSRLGVMRWALVGAIIGAIGIGLPQLFWPLLLAVAVFYLFAVAVVPLGDGVIAVIATGRGVAYGTVRQWGAVGFGLSSLLFGLLVAPLGLRSIFPAFAACLALALLGSLGMVTREEPAPRERSGHYLNLLRDRQLARFLLVAGLAAIGMVMGYVYVFLHLSLLGASAGLIGAISAAGAVTEALAMRNSGVLIQKWGAPLVFAAGAGIMGIAWFGFALLPVPWLGLVAMLVCGWGVGLVWPSAVVHVSASVPAERGASAQSLLSAVMFGVASMVANQVAGLVYDVGSTPTVLFSAGGVMLVALLLFALQQRVRAA